MLECRRVDGLVPGRKGGTAPVAISVAGTGRDSRREHEGCRIGRAGGPTGSYPQSHFTMNKYCHIHEIIADTERIENGTNTTDWRHDPGYPCPAGGSERGDHHSTATAHPSHVHRARGILAVQPDGAFFWGILVLIWLAVFRMLWEVQPQGWNFMLILGILNLVFGFLAILGGSSWEAMAPIMIVSGLVVIYCLLPGTKQAFGIPS